MKVTLNTTHLDCSFPNRLPNTLIWLPRILSITILRALRFRNGFERFKLRRFASYLAKMSLCLCSLPCRDLFTVFGFVSFTTWSVLLTCAELLGSSGSDIYSKNKLVEKYNSLVEHFNFCHGWI